VYEDAQMAMIIKKAGIVSDFSSNRKEMELHIQLHKEGKY
jgi:hypothetical protein